MKHWILVSPLTIFYVGVSANALAGPLLDELSTCRSIASDDARLACYDMLADRDKKPTASPQPPVPEPQTTSDISQEERFGKSDAEVQRTLEKARGTESLDRLRARVRQLHYSNSQRAIVELDNGQVWRQTDSGDLRLSEGDEVIIRKASLGSFMMQKAGSKRSKRVKRVR